MTTHPKSATAAPETLSFSTAKEWERWLAKNQSRMEGIWLRLFKVGSGIPSVSYDEALDGALCYGWIDGQLKPGDALSYLRKFTPRRTRSPWSKRNIDHALRLTRAGRMKPAGLAQIRAAKADGRWEGAYGPGSTMTVPPDFLARLAKNRKAMEFFATLSKSNTSAIAWWLRSAKRPETREKRMREILRMLARREKLHD